MKGEELRAADQSGSSLMKRTRMTTSPLSSAPRPQASALLHSEEDYWTRKVSHKLNLQSGVNE